MAAAAVTDSEDVLNRAEQWRIEGRRFAMATVAETWGSAPRPVGSHLIIDDDGNFTGSVSGGCVEGEVISEAGQVIADGKPKLLSFGVADETAWRVGLSCGGKISVLLQAIDDSSGNAGPLIEHINLARRKRDPVVLATDMASGRSEILRGSDPAPTQSFGLALKEHLERGASGVAALAGDRFMVSAYRPAFRLVLLGAVHITQALVPMAKAVGFEVAVIDPRKAFATPQRLPGVRLFADWPDEVLPEIGIDRFTAFAALTHDPKIDDAGLHAALEAGCFYVGALGSTRTHQRRVDRLRALGLDDSLIASIHAPIGLAIGAKSPAEIAVAILAEMIRDKGALARSNKGEVE